MYHEVLRQSPGAGSGEYFAVSRESFSRDLDLMHAAGYRGCSLAEALAQPAARRAAITFDDGTAGHYDHALPELVARDMSGTFFVTSAWIGRPGYVSWSQLREMAEAGMEIGSHTRTHPFLSELGRNALWSELQGSREDLERGLGRPVHALALPGGDTPRRALRTLVGDAGYRVVATSRWGFNRDSGGSEGPRRVRRCTVHQGAASGELRAILAGSALLSSRRQVREAILGALRRALGPSRYARWRRGFLDTADGGGGPGSAGGASGC